MDSMFRNRPLTFRVENIPPGTTAEELIKRFYTEDQPRIQVRSLVPAVDSYELDIRDYTATVSFQAANQSVLSPRLLDEDIGIDCDFHGFTPLYNPQEPIAADIIAVTGLAAHAFGSWAHSARNMWLRDYLPRDISNARVLIYGYPSQLHGNNSRSILSDHSTNMIHRLLNMREMAKCQDRPIVFIGHSLGCLIIKKALCDINGSVGIYSSRLPVRSIIFLGAPHKGLETTALETLVKSQATEDMIRELRSESPTLTELNDKFRHVAQHFDILTCYELSPTKAAIEMPDGAWKREGPPIMMVSLDSARQWYPREEFVACNADHRQIAKLKRGENSIYPSVRWAVKKALLSAGDLYSEATGIHYGESRNLQSADEASATRPSLSHITHRQTSTSSDDRMAGSALTPSRSLSEDTIDQQIRRLELGKSANRGDIESKSNPFNKISHWCSDVDVSKCDDIQSSTASTKFLDTDKAYASFAENNATGMGTDLEVTASEYTRQDSIPDPTRKEHDENEAPLTEDLNVSTKGTKSMIMDEVMESAITENGEAKTRELLAHGYDVNCKDDDDMTPLLLAARLGHEDIVSLLLEQGAHPRARCCKGQTTLHWLTMNPRRHITETLIDLLLRNPPPFEVADSNGLTPLMAACTSGHLLLATRLIRHGADVRAKDSSGQTALYHAAYNGRAQMISLLLDHGAELETKCCQGRTPLHAAAIGPSDSSDTLEQLIRAGADKEATCPTLLQFEDTHFRPLHLASQQGHKACVTYLLESGANIEAPTSSLGWRPLHYAAQGGQVEAFKAILDHGANIEARSNKGSRPLYIATYEGRLEVIKTILEYGVDIEARNSDGFRPLHVAAYNGQLETIKALLDRGANPTAKTSKLAGLKPSGMYFTDSVSDEQKQAIRKLLKEAEKIWKKSGMK